MFFLKLMVPVLTGAVVATAAGIAKKIKDEREEERMRGAVEIEVEAGHVRDADNKNN